MTSTELTPEQIELLKQRLLDERQKLLEKGASHFEVAVGLESSLADEMDQAARDQELGMLLRLADNERVLVQEIDAALARVADGSYGLCEGSGEPIGFRRLETRPWARYSVGYKEQLEREERMLRGK
ncbi:MAG: C4-type zinc finger protein DksA/TraR family [Myxococcaceae bacterium]|nr:C4-type zinc finger protein DksA/TraR family [Myxococcaceae bacterium]